MSAPTSEGPLSVEQVSQYLREGYLAIDEPQLRETEIYWCRQALLKLIANGTGKSEGRNFDLAARSGEANSPLPQILQPSLYDTELRNLSFRPVALALAKQLLGPDATFAGDHAILKPSHIGGGTPWHQDEAFRDPNLEYKELSIWIALNDCSVENGAMRYIPRSHLLGVLPHRLYGGSLEANSIECCSGFEPSRAVARPIMAGGVIIHDGRMVHGASENKTGSPRLAYIIQYSTPPVHRRTAREFPWLQNLRRTTQATRIRSLISGGIFPEMLRILRSDRYSHQHFISGFIRRRMNRLRKLFRQ